MKIIYREYREFSLLQHTIFPLYKNDSMVLCVSTDKKNALMCLRLQW